MLGWCYGDHERAYQVTGLGVALPGSWRACSVQTVFRSLKRHSSNLCVCYVNKRTKHLLLLPPEGGQNTQPVAGRSLTAGLSHLQHSVNSSILKVGLDSHIFELGIC